MMRKRETSGTRRINNTSLASGNAMARLFQLIFWALALTVAVFAQQADRVKLVEVFAAAHRAGNFDGVAVITIDGNTVLTSAAGFSDRKAKTPMRP
jgi:hypothetical protein